MGNHLTNKKNNKNKKVPPLGGERHWHGLAGQFGTGTMATKQEEFEHYSQT